MHSYRTQLLVSRISVGIDAKKLLVILLVQYVVIVLSDITDRILPVRINAQNGFYLETKMCTNIQERSRALWEGKSADTAVSLNGMCGGSGGGWNRCIFFFFWKFPTGALESFTLGVLVFLSVVDRSDGLSDMSEGEDGMIGEGKWGRTSFSYLSLSIRDYGFSVVVVLSSPPSVATTKRQLRCLAALLFASNM